MKEVNFLLKRFQDFGYKGEWKEQYYHLYEKSYELLNNSLYPKRNIYIKSLDEFNGIMMDLPHSLGHEEKLTFRRNQKHIIDLLYQIKEENKKIFVSFGRESRMKDKVCTFLGKTKMDFVVIDEEDAPYSPETFVKYAKDCEYGIFLFSADQEIGTTGKFQTHSNVMLELGYFIGQTSLKNLIAFHPSDKFIETGLNFQGISYEEFTPKGGWKITLLNHMKNSGIYVDHILEE
ncbi:MAG: nucleotide-binding protein [Sporocytophaga sp.]|nr:nucleotide-binding protein [Sporocytophaga sp.]